MAHLNRNSRQRARLDAASLDELMAQFPAEWETVGQALVEATAQRRPAAIEAFVRGFQDAARPHEQRVEKSGKNPQALAVALPFLVRKRMAMLAARSALQAAAMGASSGRRRFGLWSGFLVQRLFFAHGLARKPVSMRAFKWLWPLVTQKRLLMPLVQTRGMYAFYSQELVSALADIIAGRSALEIAAGDGCLSDFLRRAGVPIRATDDHSWTQNIPYPESVEKLDAIAALAKHEPEVVVCCYPPPKNSFERAVFATPSVDIYVVITTRHKFAAGDWEAYEAQRGFEVDADKTLARLILPPEIDPLLLVFRRRKAGARGG
jgi:hypothetical protein